MEENKNPLGIYVHIPFCIEKCSYCGFLSFSNIEEKVQKDYANKLIEEINHYGEVYNNRYYVDSIFIGGGTPSLIDETLIASIIWAIKVNFIVVDDAEITIEANPRTLTFDKLKTYRVCGINRLSMGAQSFDNKVLKSINRAHTVKDIYDNFEMARQAGFENINIDLMFSLPDQTQEILETTINEVAKLNPEHISFYSLQIEEETPLYKRFEEGLYTPTDDETDRLMYKAGIDLLKKYGYIQYEISNFSKKNFECRHNLKYWSLLDYLGVGLGAHSYINHVRTVNSSKLDIYLNNKVDKLTVENHKNIREEDIAEYIITTMRRTEGLEFEDFNNRFKEDFKIKYEEIIDKLVDKKLVLVENGRIKLSEAGRDVSNDALSEFL